MTRLGVCSWSLQPESAGELVAQVRETGLLAVQLALDPVRRAEMPLPGLRSALAWAGVTVVSGMMAMAGEDYSTLEAIRRTGGIVPDATWEANLAAAHANAVVAERLGLRLVTFHAGFIPHDAGSPGFAVLLDRVRRIAGAFAERGIRVALETGQETAAALLDLLRGLDTAGIGVNFDPANMIMYGMGDPIAALRALAPHVVQLHVKDALPARHLGEWGTEVPVGEGTVDWQALFGVLRAKGMALDLVIEREAGGQRILDVRTAAALVRAHGTAA
jgi:sugar phosphate isomerase/epimerase